MELNDYKGAMSSLRIADSTKRRILANCKNGVQPRELVSTRRMAPALRKTLALVATLATVVVVAVGLVLLMRFIGPETPPVNDGGNAGSEFENEFTVNGFRLISVESTLEGLTARIDSYDNKTKTVGMSWVNNSGNDLGLGRAYSLMKLDGDTWTAASFEKQVAWEEDFREFPNGTECSNYGVIGSLTRWSDNITAGRYKVEKEFSGSDGNKYTVTLIFELTASREINGFKLISVESTLDGLTATIDSYNAQTKSIGMTWVNNSGQDLIFGEEYTILKLIDGEWSAWADKEAIFQADARLFPNGDTCSDYGVIGSLTRWSDNITPGQYKVEKTFTGSTAYTVTIIFELLGETEIVNDGISNFRYISSNDKVGVSFGGFENEKLTIVYTNEYTDLYYNCIYYLNVRDENGEWFRPADVDFIQQEIHVPKGSNNVKSNIYFNAYLPRGAEPGEYKIELTLYAMNNSDSVKLELYFTFNPDNSNKENEETEQRDFSISRFDYYDLDPYEIPYVDLIPLKCTEDGILKLECNNNKDTTYIFRGMYSMYERTTDKGDWVRLMESSSETSETWIHPLMTTTIDINLKSYFPNGIKPGEYKIEFELTVPNGVNMDREMGMTFVLGRPSTPAEIPDGIDMTPTTSGLFVRNTSFSGGESMMYYYMALEMQDGFAKDTLIVPKTYDGSVVTAIGSNAFYRSELKYVVLNDTIRYIAVGGFKESKKLETVIFGKDVWKIDQSAFAMCTSLKYVYLNEGLFYIGMAAFYGCTSLTEINIPSTVRTIHKDAFTECENLKEINYNGTMAEWEAVNKISGWISSPLTVHCLDGDVIEEIS